MKIALITDTHCGAGNDNQSLNTFFIKFYEEVFFPYLEKHNIKNVIHLGDTFDRRKYINFKTLNSWHSKVFSKLNSMCDRVDILIGNHDTYYKNTNSINSVSELLQIYENFNSYENASEVMFGNLKLLYLPWMCEDNKEHSLNLINSTDAKICLGHLELIGFEMYAGQINVDKGLRKEMFDKFYMTMSGHFHTKSNIGEMHYLGAPYPMMWGDYGSQKGFHVLDTETMELTFIPNPIKIFKKIYYDDTDQTHESLIENSDNSDISGMFIKLIVNKKTNPYLFDKFLEKLYEHNPCDITVIESFLESDEMESAEIDQAKDTLSILKECVDLLEIDNKDSVNELMRDLYLEALNTNEHNQGD